MRFRISVFFAALAVAAGAAFAHHSGATYFAQDDPVTHTDAVVVSFTMINPHSRLVFNVNGENGEEVQWTAETQSHNALLRKGIRKDLVKSGDVVTVTGAPSLTGANYLRMTQLILPNGDTANFYGRGPAIVPAGQ